MDYELMKVCAMRLDTSVTVQHFVDAVNDIRREARTETYRAMKEFADKCGAEELQKFIDARVLGLPYELKPTV